MAQLAMHMLCVVYTALVTPFPSEREYVTPWAEYRPDMSWVGASQIKAGQAVMLSLTRQRKQR